MINTPIMSRRRQMADSDTSPLTFESTSEHYDILCVGIQIAVNNPDHDLVEPLLRQLAMVARLIEPEEYKRLIQKYSSDRAFRDENAKLISRLEELFGK